ncbi:cytochrome b/b6 domain-containing protein [Microbacterium invictum]|uniref:Thiosulfate reductase cytochrome b subunit n=1 Tax=Microbacterium invictum TaxID=515415 RepID=A0AA40VNR4_9MICO|nr:MULTISPECIES: cytochrome b/b6 domain-containing protein [Microbacterium]MBB4141122.1 thiosulfate reductase cytochrome b subunit [Microbacterium invictum]
MATYGRTLRRGLPRVTGGDAWPAAGDAPDGVGVDAGVAQAAGSEASAAQVASAEAGTSAATTAAASAAVAVAHESVAAASESVAGAHESVAGARESADAASASAVAAAGAAAVVTSIRRGLPRVTGGEPWPPASVTPVQQSVEAGVDAGDRAQATAAAVASAGAPVQQSVEVGAGADDYAQATVETAATGAAHPTAATATAHPADGAVARRGLPRTPGGEPWPPSGTVARLTAIATASAGVQSSAASADGAISLQSRQESQAPLPESGAPAAAEPAATLPAASPTAPGAPAQTAGVAAPAQTAGVAAPASTAIATAPEGPKPPLPFTPSVWPGRSATHRPKAKPEPERIGPFTKVQWAGAVIVGGLVLLILAGMAVALVRVLLSSAWGQDFLAAFPGEYHLPEGAPVGFPGWLGWQHFFNVFLMVLIIRSGLTIRTEKRPTAFWTPRGNPKGKTSLTIWFHQSLDVLWLVNGVVFVVLLFVTGQWMRVIPTSWEVIPNALSAALQYVSLDWPTENGWVNYNSLQQIAYFTTIFIAAPLAAITGARMSLMWPKDAKRLNAAYPIEWARTLHFPVMLYFVVFIAIHVFLVFATGALRNLNHMYAAQGSVDGVAYADNWTGFWMFVASLVVIAAAWVAARPLVLAPIARLFGTVSGR